tara:strand:- start:4815 stop:5063 length:249 start_codon:yes stop_codon:yes gene_type:complete
MTEFLDDTIKPEWDDAPEWANWLACGPEGLWYWYQDEPRIDEALFDWDGEHGSVFEMHFPQDHPQLCEDWRATLEHRPDVID